MAGPDLRLNERNTGGLDGDDDLARPWQRVR
jgi:hypothetical protein